MAKTWIYDDNGNRASVERWGSADAARASLATLRDCTDCTDCRDCSGCSWCIDCRGCSWCSECIDCRGCSWCSECIDCHGCSWCSECIDCHGCRWLRGESAVGGTRNDANVPKIPNIDAAIYAAASQPGALDMETWHTCGTTHCRAGWAVHLAGEAGYDLENVVGTELAAILIYRESGSPINPTRFYDSSEDALADMKARAEAATKGETP
jgi:hypothetical protein